MADQTLQFIITAQNNAKQAFNEAKNQLKDFEKETKDVSDTIKKMTAGFAVVGAAVGAFGVSSIKAAADIETQKIGFQTLLGSMEEADEAIKMIQRDAASTPFEFAGLVEANKALTLVTKNAIQSEQVLLDVGKALAAGGKGQAELDRIIMNLQQIGNTGKITEMDIRQFGYAGVNILELLADYYGTTKEAASEMVKDSDSAFNDLAAAFAMAGKEGGKYADAFSNAGGSLNQTWSNLQDAWNIFLANEGAKLLEWAKSFIQIATKIVQETLPSCIEKIEEFTKWFSENKTAIAAAAGVITGLLVPAITGYMIPAFVNAAKMIAATIKVLTFGNPWGIAIGLIVALAAAIIMNWDLIKEKTIEIWSAINDSVSGVWVNIVSTAQSVWGGITDFFVGVWEGIKEAFKFGAALAVGLVIEYFNLFGIDIVSTMQIIIGALQMAWTTIQAAFSSALNFIKGVWNTVWTAISGFLSPIWENIKKTIGDAWNWISGKFEELSKPISDAWKSMWEGMGEVVSDVWEGIKNGFKTSINFIINGINTVINALNSVARKGGSALGMSVISIPTIPQLASGGIVNRPTLAMIGEAGPEAVLPLSSAYSPIPAYAGANINVYIQGGYYLDRDAADEIGEKIIQKLKQTMKL